MGRSWGGSAGGGDGKRRGPPLLRRLITSDGLRRTRLHDYQGNLLDPAGFLDLPHSIATAALRRLGWRSRRPWLGYRLVRRLDQLIQPDWSILEYGSGASTLWFAQRAARVVSIESDPEWYEKVRREIERRQQENVDLRLRSAEHVYITAIDPTEGPFDLALIDGKWRDRCAVRAAPAVHPGGYLVLDNSDVPDEEHQGARRVLEEATETKPEIFVDLVPGMVGVTQALLVRTGGSRNPPTRATSQA